MTRKPVDTHTRKKKPPQTPSTGFGADSAFDEMIKRRLGAPGPSNPPPPPKGHKKH